MTESHSKQDTIECLKCGGLFKTKCKKCNRICPKCQQKNRELFYLPIINNKATLNGQVIRKSLTGP